MPSSLPRQLSHLQRSVLNSLAGEKSHHCQSGRLGSGRQRPAVDLHGSWQQHWSCQNHWTPLQQLRSPVPVRRCYGCPTTTDGNGRPPKCEQLRLESSVTTQMAHLSLPIGCRVSCCALAQVTMGIMTRSPAHPLSAALPKELHQCPAPSRVPIHLVPSPLNSVVNVHGSECCPVPSVQYAVLRGYQTLVRLACAVVRVFCDARVSNRAEAEETGRRPRRRKRGHDRADMLHRQLPPISLNTAPTFVNSAHETRGDRQ